ncbi:hypothetical protein GCM10022204_18860 [Microlunatus aurantiacus]|uniref:DUF3592 domain-containing protein n=1 Tax=Microlunatus aurantiacus TaxID=446786 RepID=A0ABP7DBR6_9ACTN
MLLPLLVLGFWLSARHEADRFAHHSVLADARITGSDLGCLGAMGSPSSTGVGWRNAIRYDIAIPYAGGVHLTRVTRPCDVIPPDFGRGRGYIWVEYDVDHPDRVRVQGDPTADARVRWLWQLLVTVLAAEGFVLLWRRRQSTAVAPAPRR